ncbi:MAG: M23 family metallopeptidase [Polyangiaceae bacterium]|nr:M23 family metallopeptidase [Polyangiaceae bacterium]MCL4753062.1 M23 family metallopeptidase [Myxococcales bacterium]
MRGVVALVLACTACGADAAGGSTSNEPGNSGGAQSVSSGGAWATGGGKGKNPSSPSGGGAAGQAGESGTAGEAGAAGQSGAAGESGAAGAGGSEPSDPCAGLDYTGKCEGSVLVWCEEGALKKVDCAADGRKCGWQDANVGYNCLKPAPPPGSLGFGYPVGDKTTYPAGGWMVSQVLGNYLYSPPFVGGHLAEDVFNPNGPSANQPVYSVADGTVAFAGTNSSSYKNVVMIKHDLGNGTKICSFYGHLWPPVVSTGQSVKRGQKIAEVMDWAYFYGNENSHLHYALVTEAVCNQALGGSGALCGYDQTSGPNGISDLTNEPATYTSAGDACGSHKHANGYIAPSKFIKANHF